ncbi:unnamed protein product [Notodromas monacha]|uniref:Histone-lysine N-methyltransferase n=1 Tax=Notodromas monacha TaxID=399045 RepID=A0A7R9GBE6_9CRUS|nr:unnamed protein product [Notodromas monacha]CAG0916426.1 unnamed protein product [Notodromas monacha]
METVESTSGRRSLRAPKTKQYESPEISRKPAAVKKRKAEPVVAIPKRQRSSKAIFEVDFIVDHRLHVPVEGEDSEDKFEFLIRWKGFDQDEDTWEPEENLGCPDKLIEYRSKIFGKMCHSKSSGINEDAVEEKLASLRNQVELLSDNEVLGKLTKLKSEGVMDPYLSAEATVARGLLFMKYAEEQFSIAQTALMITRKEKQSERQKEALKEFERMIAEKCPDEARVYVENDVDDDTIPSDFTYIRSSFPGEGVTIPDDPLTGCSCECCSVKSAECCPKMNGTQFAYNPSKKVKIPPGFPIYECNKHCKCPSACNNRVVQLGRQVEVVIFKTENKGWGVKAKELIKKGTFVACYIGEIITNSEAERRGHKYGTDAEGRTYLFDLDFDSSTNVDFVVDAAKHGNVSHFVNHSCDPNLGVYACYIDCLLTNMPHLALFARRDIKKGEELTFDYSPVFEQAELTPKKLDFSEEAESDVKSEAEEKSESEEKNGTEVKSETEEKNEAEVKNETNAKSDLKDGPVPDGIANDGPSESITNGEKSIGLEEDEKKVQPLKKVVARKSAKSTKRKPHALDEGRVSFSPHGGARGRIGIKSYGSPMRGSENDDDDATMICKCGAAKFKSAMADGLTLFIRKLPEDATTKEVENLFSEYGPLSKCFVVPTKDGKKAKGRVAFVTFSLPEDGYKAAEKLNGFSVREHEISVEPAKSKKQLRDENVKISWKKPKDSSVGDKPEINRKARLIVRNLPFAADEDKLQHHFEACGKVLETRLLRRDDGRLVGCGFVQFNSPNEAAKAVKNLNAKKFLGRPIAVDWAVSKNRYLEAVDSTTKVETDSEKPKVEVKDENEVSGVKRKRSVDETPGKPKKKRKRKNKNQSQVEPQESDGEFPTIKSENEDSEVDDEAVVKEEPMDAYFGGKTSDESDDEVNSGSDESGDDDETEENETEKKKNRGENPPERPAISRDVREGKTVFVMNVPFSVSEEDLSEFMSSAFGPVKYSLFNIDPVTMHPKGTAFVQFQNLKGAEAILSAPEESLVFSGRTLKVVKALGRGGAGEVKKDHEMSKVKPIKDKRNLYLAREGLIREGTASAAGVSPHDLTLRQNLAKYKKNVLKDLTMFVSPTRLCIHNVPFSMDSKELREVMRKNSPKGAAITECRVMRDKKNGNVSKGFAFVAFSEPEHALEALRELNNNPKTFSAKRRPIVEFSIENALALKAREKRLARSKEKLPQSNKSETGAEETPADSRQLSKRQMIRLKSLERYRKKRLLRRAAREGEEGTGVQESPAVNRVAKKLKLKASRVVAGNAERKRLENGKGNKSFLGATSDPAKKGVVGLPSHDGPKKRHKARPGTAISRKMVRKQAKNPNKKPAANPAVTAPPPAIAKQGKKSSAVETKVPKSTPTTKKKNFNQQSTDRAGAKFQALVDKYKMKLSQT